MIYRASHLLIGEGLFSAGGSRNNIAVKGGGTLHDKKNIGGCVLSTQPDQQKRPQWKNAQKIIKH